MRYILLIITLLIALNVKAQEYSPDTLQFSLSEAIVFAVENNLNAKNARLDVRSADKRIWETAASGLPQVNAAATYNNNLSLATTLIPDFFNDPTQKIEIQFGTKHFATAGISASQLIFSGQYIVGLQTARLYREFSEKNLDLTEQQVATSVTQGYHLVLLAERTLEALRGNLENMRRTYLETTVLFESGFLEENDVDQLEITMTDLENSVLSMERQLIATRSLLKYQMGLPPDMEIVLTDALTELVSELDYTAMTGAELDLSSNLEYQLLNDQEKLAMMDYRQKKAEFMPNLSAFLSMDYTAKRDEFNFFDSNESWYQASAVGLSLNVPIFSSGMRMAGVSQKRIAYEKARNTKTFAAEGLQVEYMQAQYDFSNAYEKYRREKRNLELTRKVVRNTEIKYNEGMASSLELTQVNDQFLQTLGSYTSAMVDLLNAKVSLDILLNNI
ncbi:MAG: TolC family protein [Bacteroidales bacterium]|nr:TolC family protein [Bacteroidales bacterium]